jgi:pSer/pThr/pTyr-binding forkhead associated (FHA) protein
MAVLSLKGPADEREVDLGDAECVIGRDPTAEIVLNDPKASRRHARLFRNGDTYFVEDLGSANGVQVRGAPIDGPRAIAHGGSFEIGDVVFTLQYAVGTPGHSGFSLVGRAAPLSGQTFPLPRGTVLIGRGSTCEIVANDPSVSRQHARLQVEEGALVVRDLGSSNGTYVNDREVRTRKLKHGDVLRVGKVPFAVDAVGATGGAGPDWVLRATLGIGGSTLVLLAVVLGVLWQRRTAREEEDPFVQRTLTIGRLNDEAEVLRGAGSVEESLRKFEEVLALAPLDERAREAVMHLRSRRQESDALANAKALLLQGEAQGALDMLAVIGPGALLYGEAQSLARRARTVVCDRLVEKARSACGRREWLDCHAAATAALDLSPGRHAAQRLLQQAEKSIRRRR